jgi:hypothetical protein
MKAPLALLVILLALSSAGCATQVDEDYSDYLANNQGRVIFPRIDMPAQYYLDEETANHSVEIKAWMTGIGNSWTVRMGEILDATLQGQDMQVSFDSLSKADSDKDTDELTLLFHLNRYQFANFHAFIDLRIEARRNGNQLLSERYIANGKSQGKKMFWGTAFAMKNAIQQSTKLALDEILANFLNDLNKALAAGVVAVPGGLNFAMNRRDGSQARSCGLKPLGDQDGLGSCLVYSRGT